MVRFETVLHGQRVSYHQAGSGPLIVLLHGIAGDSGIWKVRPPVADGDDTRRRRPISLATASRASPRATARSGRTPMPCR